jgi:DNA-binding transcriptional ArsR family regulator
LALGVGTGAGRDQKYRESREKYRETVCQFETTGHVFSTQVFKTNLRWSAATLAQQHDAPKHHLDMQPFGCLLMVTMDEVFKALADASRRSLLDRLHLKNGQTLNDLCEGLAMTRQAVTKHLVILEAANLVTTFRHGREKLHYLNPVPIHQIGERWIRKFERGKLTALSELKRQLEKRDE